MSASVKRRRILEIIASDSTFELVKAAPGESYWRGKCIHCRSWLHVAADGEPISEATIEHLVPRSRGGGDDVDNLALACARCNHEKGRRHDVRGADDTRAAAVLERLMAEKRKRSRRE